MKWISMIVTTALAVALIGKGYSEHKLFYLIFGSITLFVSGMAIHSLWIEKTSNT